MRHNFELEAFCARDTPPGLAVSEGLDTPKPTRARWPTRCWHGPSLMITQIECA